MENELIFDYQKFVKFSTKKNVLFNLPNNSVPKRSLETI